MQLPQTYHNEALNKFTSGYSQRISHIYISMLVKTIVV